MIVLVFLIHMHSTRLRARGLLPAPDHMYFCQGSSCCEGLAPHTGLAWRWPLPLLASPCILPMARGWLDWPGIVRSGLAPNTGLAWSWPLPLPASSYIEPLAMPLAWLRALPGMARGLVDMPRGWFLLEAGAVLGLGNT